MQPMPGAVPVTTEGSEWQRMLEKDTSVMTYRAWRHHLPVRARPTQFAMRRKWRLLRAPRAAPCARRAPSRGARPACRRLSPGGRVARPTVASAWARHLSLGRPNPVLVAVLRAACILAARAVRRSRVPFRHSVRRRHAPGASGVFQRRRAPHDLVRIALHAPISISSVLTLACVYPFQKGRPAGGVRGARGRPAHGRGGCALGAQIPIDVQPARLCVLPPVLGRWVRAHVAGSRLSVPS
jgi:hypothetical protein